MQFVIVVVAKGIPFASFQQNNGQPCCALSSFATTPPAAPAPMITAFTCLFGISPTTPLLVNRSYDLQGPRRSDSAR